MLDEVSPRKALMVCDELPDSIAYEEGRPATLGYEDGTTSLACCIECINPSCMLFSDEEVEYHGLDEFAYDMTRAVCPSAAIQWDDSLEHPSIDPERCINCGLCMKRCPVGAIYHDTGTRVATLPNGHLASVPLNGGNVARQERLIADLWRVDRTGILVHETDERMEMVYAGIRSRLASGDDVLLVRNLFLSLNCSCAMRRVGDVYTRMDAVYSTNRGDSFGAIEVEFGPDTLDASRAVLDDIAVLFARYGIQKEHNDAVVVCLRLPNARQGYWQVIRDVRNVAGIRINTVSLGALLLLLWNMETFNVNETSYYADYDDKSIRRRVEQQIGRPVALSSRAQGVLEPRK